jgi:Spy/CpxP family protein refolding chaperone
MADMGAPKSAVELVMERLKQKDAAAGVDQQKLTDAQRAAIAEVRRGYEAQAAQRKIMHQSALSSAASRNQRDEREAELRQDLERFERERDAKIAKIREGSLD